MINGNNKGKVFERDIAHLLSEITQVSYRRSPSSGSYRVTFPGDIIKEHPTDESVLDNVLLECKNYGTLQVPKWIREAKEEAKDGSLRHFMIIMKVDSKPYFLIPESLLRDWVEQLT